MKVYVNGSVVDQEQAVVPIGDAGLQHGVGLFETMGAYHGRAFRLGAHVDRLIKSSQELGMARDLDAVELADAVRAVIDANGLERARVRLTVTGGGGSILNGDPGAEPRRTVVAVATDPTEYDPAYFDRGVMVLMGVPAANPFDPVAGHKTLAYWSRLMTLRRAAGAGAGEVIWLNISHHLASGAISNLFLVRDGELLTPIARGEEVSGALVAPVLPGVTRAAVIELAGSVGITTQRKMLTVTDLLEADEVFLTNSSWLVLPVTGVEKTQIAGGGVGPITRQLRDMMLKLVESETSGESVE